MALCTCTECTHQISERAEKCPNCGHPFDSRALHILVAIAFTLYLVGAIFLASIGRSADTSIAVLLAGLLIATRPR